MIFRIVIFCLCVTMVLVILKENYRAMAIVVTVVACAGIMLFCSSMFSDVIAALSNIQSKVNVNKKSVVVVVKALAVSYITSFGTDICNDAGERAIANALETSGKIIMLSMAFPMLAGIFTTVTDIIG